MKRHVATVTIKLSMNGWCHYSIAAIAEFVGRAFGRGATFDVDVVSITMAEDS